MLFWSPNRTGGQVARLPKREPAVILHCTLQREAYGSCADDRGLPTGRLCTGRPAVPGGDPLRQPFLVPRDTPLPRDMTLGSKHVFHSSDKVVLSFMGS